MEGQTNHGNDPISDQINNIEKLIKYYEETIQFYVDARQKKLEELRTFKDMNKKPIKQHEKSNDHVNYEDDSGTIEF